LFEHDIFGKPVPTFPDHARVRQRLRDGLRMTFDMVMAASITSAMPIPSRASRN
jgi:hypothetical protein